MCIEGVVKVETVQPNGHTVIQVLEGVRRDALRVLPGTPHRFTALSAEAKLVEFSTTHSDEDVVRLEESGRIPMQYKRVLNAYTNRGLKGCPTCQGMGAVGRNADWDGIVLSSFGVCMSTEFYQCPTCRPTTNEPNNPQ